VDEPKTGAENKLCCAVLEPRTSLGAAAAAAILDQRG